MAVFKELERSIRPIDGVAEAVARLSHQLWIASGAPLNKITMMLKKCGLSRFFGQKIFSSYELNLWKPEPGLFLHAAAQLAVAPGECAVIEDSAPGVQAGVTAGMKVFHYVPGASIAHAGPVTTFGQMSELPRLLGSS